VNNADDNWTQIVLTEFAGLALKSKKLEQSVRDDTYENIQSRRNVQHSQEWCIDSVDHTDFCELAVNLLLPVEGGDFFY